MATQTLEFSAATGLTLSCKLFALESDTVVDTQTATERTNDKNRYRVAFTDVPAGAYRLNAFVGAVGGFANEIYDLTLATDVFLPRSEIGSVSILARLGTPAGASIAADIAAIEGGDGGGSGTGARTVTITVNDGSTALQNATVRLTEGSNTFTAITNVSGVATFNVDDATYTVAISKSGYSYSGTTLVVDGDETATYSMTLISISAPDDPGLATLTVKCVSETGLVESGVEVSVEIVDIPTSGVGYAYDNTIQSATSNASGIATLTVVRGATYRIKRNDANTWKKVVIADSAIVTVTSVIGP